MKKVTYSGLGFPIILEGVKTREFRGEILPDINHRELEDLVFKTLLWLPAHFSGAHLSFVRGYMGLSQKEFATMLGLKTHKLASSDRQESWKQALSGCLRTLSVIRQCLNPMRNLLERKPF